MNSKTVIGIFLAALALRLVALGSTPPGFTPDEASQAYSAYSLLKTGHDEWGVSWPLLSFTSFLDHKAPLLTYLMIPSIATFGLTEFATRLPSAIFGALAIFPLYFLTQKLFPKKKHVATLAAALLTITPWHFQFSRMALEANLISLLFPLGLLGLVSHKQDMRWLYVTAVSWGLSFYAYHATKIFIPLFSLSAILIYRKELLKAQHLFPAIVFSLLAAPVFLASVFGNVSSRGGDLLITNFSREDLKIINDSRYYTELNSISPKLSPIFHNKLSFTLDKFAENYVSYLSPTFWFTEGGREITYSIIPGTGLLYLWQLPFVVYGLYTLFSGSKDKKVKLLLTAWLLLAPVSAAITKEGYRPNRASAFLGFWALISAYGITSFFAILPKKKHQLFSLILSATVLVSALFYLNDYFFAAQVKYPRALSYGWREAITELTELQPRFSNTVIERGSQSQVYLAFYQQLDPETFQTDSSQWENELKKHPDVKYLDQLPRYPLDGVTIRSLGDYKPDTLYLSHTRNNLPKNRQTLHTVNTPDDLPIIEIFTVPDEN